MAKNIVNWEAREYIARDKNAWWYVCLAIIALGLCALAIWQQEWSFLAVIIAATAALLVYTVRPPRVLHYSLDEKGLTEGNNL